MMHSLRNCFKLYNLLLNQQYTKREILEMWTNYGSNQEIAPLTERTFSRMLRTTEKLFHTTISIKQKHGSYYYCMTPMEGFVADEEFRWNLKLGESLNFGQGFGAIRQVEIRPAARSVCLLPTLLGALEKAKLLRIRYRDEARQLNEVQLVPLLLTDTHEGWLVTGENAADGELQVLKLPFIQEVTPTGTSRVATQQNKKAVQSGNYFDGCYGADRSGERIELHLRADATESILLHDNPLHTSQERGEQHEQYTDFHLSVRPTRELMLALLRRDGTVIVLAPKWFDLEVQDLAIAQQRKKEADAAVLRSFPK